MKKTEAKRKEMAKKMTHKHKNKEEREDCKTCSNMADKYKRSEDGPDNENDGKNNRKPKEKAGGENVR